MKNSVLLFAGDNLTDDFKNMNAIKSIVFGFYL